MKLPSRRTLYECIVSPALSERSIGRASGGLAVIYNEHFKCEILDKSVHWLFVKIICKNFVFVLGSIYFKPVLEFRALLDMLQVVLDELEHNFKHLPILIGGDFNSRLGTLIEFMQITDFNPHLQIKRNSFD